MARPRPLKPVMIIDDGCLISNNHPSHHDSSCPSLPRSILLSAAAWHLCIAKKRPSSHRPPIQPPPLSPLCSPFPCYTSSPPFSSSTSTISSSPSRPHGRHLHRLSRRPKYRQRLRRCPGRVNFNRLDLDTSSTAPPRLVWPFRPSEEGVDTLGRPRLDCSSIAVRPQPAR